MARPVFLSPLSCLIAVFFIASTARAETPAGEEFFEKEVRPRVRRTLRVSPDSLRFAKLQL